VEAVGEFIVRDRSSSEFGSTEIAICGCYAASGRSIAASRIAVVDKLGKHWQHAGNSGARRPAGLTRHDYQCATGNVSEYRRAARKRNPTGECRVDQARGNGIDAWRTDDFSRARGNFTYGSARQRASRRTV
jgi:hypothetical protein